MISIAKEVENERDLQISGLTLKQRIDIINSFRDISHFVGEFSLDDDINEVYAQTLSSFYAENPLAEKVALENTSYREKVRPIQRAFSPLSRRVFLLPRGKEIRKYTNTVLDSMNAVGAMNYVFDDFPTKERKKEMGQEDSVGVVVGLTFATITATAAYGIQTFEGHPLETMLKIATPLLATLPFLYFRTVHRARRILREDVANLISAAEETDRFLLEHPPIYVDEDQPTQINKTELPYENTLDPGLRANI